MGRVTEKKRVKVDHSCVDSPCFLNWEGTSGGREYWLFKKRQSKGIAVTVNGSYQPYVRDIENAQSYIFDTGREATPRLTMGGHAPAADIEAISRVMFSTNVLLLMNPNTWETDLGGPRWQVVRPLPGTFKIVDTDQVYGNIELTVELPFINIQST